MLLALNQAGFGANVVALFDNGRIEEFLWAKTLEPEEMCSPELVPRIAKRVRELHNLNLNLEDVPAVPSLFGTIYAWLVMARGLKFEDPSKQALYDEIDFHAFEKEIREIESVCKLTESPCVFGHNDLLSGNILIIQVRHCHFYSGI